jgi:hypothetical protein
MVLSARSAASMISSFFMSSNALGNVRRPKPPLYGDWWRYNDKGIEWYEEIYESRKPMHETFRRWVSGVRASGERLESFLEVGCGRAVGYEEFFRNDRYVGYDISEKEISWCRLHRKNPRHEYATGDFIQDGIRETFDVVFSHAVIDHVYDVDALVSAMVGASRHWIYLNSYRGWFPHLKDHAYHWADEHHCYYNDISPRRLARLLARLGCRDVQVFPIPTGQEAIPFETVIIARTRPARRSRWANRFRALLWQPPSLSPAKPPRSVFSVLGRLWFLPLVLGADLFGLLPEESATKVRRTFAYRCAARAVRAYRALASAVQEAVGAALLSILVLRGLLRSAFLGRRSRGAARTSVRR